MPSDLSRLTFDRRKNYSGVRMQQGRVLLDADWNEQLDIQQYRTHVQTQDVIGQSGVPKGSEGFQAHLESGRLKVKKGRIYVEGLLCESDEATLVENIPDPLEDGAYLVYLEAWQREVSYLDDPSIQEVALGGTDTTTRMQTVWQVKLLAVDGAVEIGEISEIIKVPNGMLTAQTAENADLSQIQNQLYRIEIHKSGDKEGASFKWSRENASVETKIEQISNNVLKVRDIGENSALGFGVDQWAEIVNEEAVLKGSSGELVKITAVDETTREITLQQTPGIVMEEGADLNLKLRRWDQQSEAGVLSLSGEWINLENGVQVQFSEGDYRSGDYWLAPARQATANIEWDHSQHPDGYQAPRGIKRRYCKLALLKAEGGDIVSLEDCRAVFPALTNLQATDIDYDNSVWELTEANTVQEALDELCRQEVKRACTYVVFPEVGWEKVFDEIGEGEDAKICFKTGTYPLSGTKQIDPKGHILMSGCGWGTKIIAENASLALSFVSCKSVAIRDLSVETKRANIQDPYGALSFNQCGKVDLENIEVKCAGGTSDGPFKTSSCLSMFSCGDVQVLNSRFLTGYLQMGINIMQPQSILIENNAFEVYDSEELTLDDLLEDEIYLLNTMRFLVSDPSLTKPAGWSTSTVGYGYTRVRQFYFKTHRVLKENWEAVINDELDPNVRFQNNNQVKNYFNEFLVNKILLDKAFRSKYEGFQKFYEALSRQKMELGYIAIFVKEPAIAIAGKFHILNNTINGFQTGIFVEHGFPKMDKILIRGNAINILQSPMSLFVQRAGIRIDHPQDLLIDNNSILLNRLPGVFNRSLDGFEDSNEVENYGIQLGGNLGNRILVTQNQVNSADGMQSNSFTKALFIMTPMSATAGSGNLWAVSWNILMGSKVNYDVLLAEVSITDNIPTESYTE